MDLTALRGEIDRIDDKLLALFLRRMDIVKGVAQYKIDNGLPVLNSARESEILARAREKSGEDMAGYTEEFFRVLMAVSREMQQEMLQKNMKQPSVKDN